MNGALPPLNTMS